MRNSDTGKTVIVPYHSLFYPAIFHNAEEGGFWITFPDIPECMSQGDDMQQAYETTVDALDVNFSQVLQEALIQKITKSI